MTTGDPINVKLAMQMQSAIISAMTAEIEELNSRINHLTAENMRLDKQAKGIYGEYQLLQYEIRSLPTQAEYCQLRQDMLTERQRNDELQAEIERIKQ